MRAIISAYARIACSLAQRFAGVRTARDVLRQVPLALAVCMLIATASVSVLSQAWRAFRLDTYRPSIPSELFDRKGRLIATFFQDQRILVPEKDIAQHLKQAFIAMEDNHFFNRGYFTAGNFPRISD